MDDNGWWGVCVCGWMVTDGFMVTVVGVVVEVVVVVCVCVWLLLEQVMRVSLPHISFLSISLFIVVS